MIRVVLPAKGLNSTPDYEMNRFQISRLTPTGRDEHAGVELFCSKNRFPDQEFAGGCVTRSDEFVGQTPKKEQNCMSVAGRAPRAVHCGTAGD